MKSLFRFLSALLLIGALPFASSATHFVGSQLTYQSVPGLPGYYLVSLKIYRDCGGATFGNTFDVSINSACATLPDLTVVLNSAVEVSEVCDSTQTECTGGGGSNIAPGIEEYVYTGLINMSQAAPCADWTFSFTNCCRNGDIRNLSNAASDDFYTEAILNTGTSNSPIVNSNPLTATSTVPYVCINDTVTFNPQAVDPDGDSLVFSLATALGGQAPSPITLGYNAGYSFAQPFGSAVMSNLDSQTGQFNVIPDTFGAFVVIIKIDEYRTINGVVTKVGTSQQDLQFQVVNCATLCVQAGNTLSINNGNTTAGASETIATQPGQALAISIPVASQASVQLVLTSSNHQAVAPGSTFTTTGTGNQVTGHFNWTPTAAQVRSQPYFINYFVTDNACPVPNERYGVLRVLVTNTVLAAAPQVTATELQLPTLLHKGEALVLPVELQGSKLQVFDQTGKLVHEQAAYHNGYRAPQSAAGMYLYRVTPTGQKEPISAKLMIGQ